MAKQLGDVLLPSVEEVRVVREFLAAENIEHQVCPATRCMCLCPWKRPTYTVGCPSGRVMVDAAKIPASRGSRAEARQISHGAKRAPRWSKRMEGGSSQQQVVECETGADPILRILVKDAHRQQHENTRKAK